MENLFTKWGLDISDDDSVIRQCYRKRVQMFHPDKVGFSEKSQEEFCLLQEEYAILKDPMLRQQHIEEMSSLGRNQQAEQVSTPQSPRKTSESLAQTLSNLYIPSSPINLTVRIPLSVVAQGGNATVIFSISIPCSCARQYRCSRCHGTGLVEKRNRLRLIFKEGIENGKILAFPQKGHKGTHETGTVFVHVLWSQMKGWKLVNNQLKKRIYISPHRQNIPHQVVWFKTPKNTFGFFEVPLHSLPVSVVIPAGFKNTKTVIELVQSPWWRRPWDVSHQACLGISGYLVLILNKTQRQIFNFLKSLTKGPGK